MCIYTVPRWASQLVFSDVLHFDTIILLLTVTLRGYLISIAYCLFIHFILLINPKIASYGYLWVCEIKANKLNKVIVTLSVITPD